MSTALDRIAVCKRTRTGVTEYAVRLDVADYLLCQPDGETWQVTRAEKHGLCYQNVEDMWDTLLHALGETFVAKLNEDERTALRNAAAEAKGKPNSSPHIAAFEVMLETAKAGAA